MPRLPAGLTALNTAQFLGAMNDNILKLLIVYFLIQHQGAAQAGLINASSGMAFALPFLLLSAPAGCLADRYRKSRVSVVVKLLEVMVTALAVAAFALRLTGALYGLLFLMACHSALFAPAKYGIIPELAPREELSRANGLIESCTFLAIIFGTTLASLLTQASNGRFWTAALCCLALAVAGLVAALRLPAVPVAAPDRPVRFLPAEIWRTLRQVRQDRWLLLAVGGQAWFMLVGAFAQLNLIGYGMQRFALSEAESGYLFLAAALGIGAGAQAAARISGRRVELGLVPLGGAGLVLAPLFLQLAPPALPLAVGIIILFGVSAGLFSLPLQTFIQLRARADLRGEVLAAASFMNWVGILLAALLTWLCSGPLRFSAAQGFSLLGLATLAVVLGILRSFPAMGRRAVKITSRLLP